MFCPNCGKEIPDGAAFCGECGTSLAAPAAPVESAPEAAPVEPAPEAAPEAPVADAAPEAAPAAEAPAAPDAAPVAAAIAADAQPAPNAAPKEPSEGVPFGQHFKNIIKAALHPTDGIAEITPSYKKAGDAILLALIVIVVISVLSSCIDVPEYLIRVAQAKAELSSRTFRDLYGVGTITVRILKLCFYPFIRFAGRTFGIAGAFTLAGIILKEKTSFVKMLTVASLAAAPAYLVSEVLGSLIGFIPYVRFGSIISVAAYAYYLVMLYHGMSAETKIKGNKFAFAFVICIAAVAWVIGFF